MAKGRNYNGKIKSTFTAMIEANAKAAGKDYIKCDIQDCKRAAAFTCGNPNNKHNICLVHKIRDKDSILHCNYGASCPICKTCIETSSLKEGGVNNEFCIDLM